MKKILPVKVKQQSLLWKQAIRNARHYNRGYSFMGITTTLIDEHLLSGFEYQYESSQFDHLIIGSNPILTYFLLMRIHDAHKNHHKKPLHIGILFTPSSEFWGYHAFESPQTLYKARASNTPTTFRDFLNLRNDLFSNNNLHLVFIAHENITPSYCRYDAHIDGYIIHLAQRTAPIPTTDPIPSIAEAEGITSTKITNILLKHFNRLSQVYHNISQLCYSDDFTPPSDHTTPSRLLLSHKVWLTSSPSLWSHETITDPSFTHITPEKVAITQTTIQHLFSTTSFGTGLHTVHTFEHLEAQAILDVQYLLKYPL